MNLLSIFLTTGENISFSISVPFWGVVTYFVSFLLALANMWSEMKVLKTEVKNIKEILQGKTINEKTI